jgi:hypothetical protein
MKEKTYTAKEVQTGAWRQTGHYAAAVGGPAQVISAPAVVQGGGAVRLSRSSLGIDDPIVVYQGRRFSISYPASWQKGEAKDGSVAFVPSNGAGEAGISYGVLIDTVRPQNGVSDEASLARATAALVQQLSQRNAGLQQAGQMASLRLGGQAANAVELRGRSPVVEGGSTLAERDWLVTVARPDGDLNYMVFVSPEVDFAMLKPVYSAMAQSFRAQ